MRYNLLEGIRVVEVGAMWAAPYGARILGDLGAEVIKVEGPRKPEAVRFGFYAGNDPGEKPWERGGHFAKFSRNKKCLVLDLTRQRGRDLLHELLRKTDVLIENNTPRVREPLGLGHETLAREAPDLVVVSMPGFGDDGPYRDYLAFGLNIEGFAGLTAVTGYADGTPPIRSAIPYGDPVAAVYAAMTALIGLRERRKGGRALRFELSQHEGLASLLPDLLLEAQATGADPPRRGNADPLVAHFQDVVSSGDGRWLAITAKTAEQRAALAAFAACDAAVDDATLRLGLEAWIAGAGEGEAVTTLRAAGVAAAPVLSPGEMMTNEQVVARNVYANVGHPVVGSIPYSQLPLRFGDAPSQPDLYAPLFGEHNRYVFGEILGLSATEIDELYAAGLTSDAPDLGLPATPARKA